MCILGHLGEVWGKLRKTRKVRKQGDCGGNFLAVGKKNKRTRICEKQNTIFCTGKMVFVFVVGRFWFCG